MRWRSGTSPETRKLATGLNVLASYGPIGRNAHGELPLKLGEKVYARGVYCHAPSRIVVRLPGPGKTFTAVVAAAAQVTKPLAVEIHFPTITDLKQALAFDADGNLLIMIQFKAKVDQYEIFRLVNLLKQPHGSLFATIGSPQSAMDFMFTKEGKVEIKRQHSISQSNKAARTARERFSDDGKGNHVRFVA